MVDAMDRDGVKTVLPKGAIGYDDYAPGGDVGRIYIGTGTVNIPLAKKDDEATLGTPIASAATTTIGTAGLGDYIHITGTTTITSFGTASTAGIRRTLIFDGVLTLTHNATSLICVGGISIVTVAGMVIEVVAETTANWRVVSITHPSISATEMGYLDGVTSAIQTQIDGKAAINANTTGSSGSCTGNSATATGFIGTETDWASYRTRSVANMLSWKNYGNGHCIFDASAGTTPNGVAVNNTNPNTPWTPTFPTLMGWNGVGTHGVRVDSARVADSTTYASAFTTARTINGVSFDGTANIVVQDSTKIGAANYATSTVGGTVKMRISGTTLYITNNGTDA